MLSSKEWVKNELSLSDDCLTTTDRVMLSKILQDLERLEEIENANPSEALERLERINVHLETELDRDIWNKQHNTIKQALIKAQKQEKILNIILKKRIDLESFYSTFVKDDLDYKYYEKYYGTYGLEKLTQEEFDLLKEVFCNDISNRS